MIKLPPYDPDAPVIVIDIGNSNTKVATWIEDNLKSVLAAPTGDMAAFEEAYAAHRQASGRQRHAATVIGSVVPEGLKSIRTRVAEIEDRQPLVVGETLPLPMELEVKDRKTVGVDRVCQAAAAFHRVQADCTIVSFGTAVTIDLVNLDGVFLGGAILPGVAMQLRALHEFTAALPLVEAAIPEFAYGANTQEAIQTGVCRGLVGAVRGIVEGYATELNRWPQVIATGGNAALLMPLCDFVDTWTTDLTLCGIGLAYTKHLSAMGA